jgi:hypothetical protein
MLATVSNDAHATSIPHHYVCSIAMHTMHRIIINN